MWKRSAARLIFPFTGRGRRFPQIEAAIAAHREALRPSRLFTSESLPRAAGMAQIFHHSTNTIARVSIYGAVILIAILGYAVNVVNQTSYVTEVHNARPQPVPFSHKHHVGELGLDCRYCHTSVEVSSSAGMPPTQTCMTCHSQIWTNAAILEPVRASYRDSKPISWTRVNAVPDFVYFNHSIHVAKGVGCTTCHGPIGGDEHYLAREQPLHALVPGVP